MEKLTDSQKWELLEENRKAGSAQKLDDQLGAAYMVEVVAQLSSDAAADLLRSLPAEFSDQVIAGLPEDRARDVQEILAYPQDSAGSIMAKECLSIPCGMTVAEAVLHLQIIPKERKHKVLYIYVLDSAGRLEGVIQTRDLIFNTPETLIASVTRKPVVSVAASTPQKEVVRILQEGRYLALPVTAEDGRLTGIISADKLLKFVEQQADRDIAKIVGTDAEEMSADSSVPRIVRLRLPWLMVSIVSGLFCAFISGVFQNNVQTLAVLFLFVPVVLGLSESTGIQGATIVVRSLGLRAMSLKELRPLLVREVAVGVLIGVICGVIVGSVTWFWQGSWILGVAIACSMNVAIMVSAVIGLVLPVLFKTLRIDPALASGPLVLAICDIQTLFIYFNLANWILTRFSA
ncbi:MAG: magnesium transporter [Candidatus Omnitrophica bacterium]|nr:magnesium transporter [Candidatus Omnitrophota bacterium]